MKLFEQDDFLWGFGPHLLLSAVGIIFLYLASFFGIKIASILSLLLLVFGYYGLYLLSKKFKDDE